MTVCVSHAYHPRPRWMLTLRSCDGGRRWRSEFEFYVASVEQQHSRRVWGGTRDVHRWAVTDWNNFYCFSTVQHLTLCVPHLNKCLKMIRDNNNPVIDLLFVYVFDRKLYFAQHTISPYPSRVCDGPPGCVFSSGPDGPTQGSFYAPLPAGTCVALNIFEVVRVFQL